MGAGEGARGFKFEYITYRPYSWSAGGGVLIGPGGGAVA